MIPKCFEIQWVAQLTLTLDLCKDGEKFKNEQRNRKYLKELLVFELDLRIRKLKEYHVIMLRDAEKTDKTPA